MQNVLPFRRTAVCAALLAITVAPAVAGATYTWSAGNYSVTGLPLALATDDLLQVIPGSTKTLDVALNNQGQVRQTDELWLFGYGITTNSGNWELLTDHGLSNAGYSPTFSNLGTFRKTAGTGTSVYSAASFTNTGTVDVRSGALDFASGLATFNAGSQFIGAGRVLVTNNAVFNGAFTSQNVELRGGTFSGGAAQLNGVVDWTGGTLAGQWSVAAGQTLQIRTGSAKTMAASLGNAGTVVAEDDVYLFGYNKLSNTGVYELKGDVGIHSGGYTNTFANSGTLRKSAGSGVSTITAGTGFNNSGVIEVLTGELRFAGGDASFVDGTQFTGPGLVRITSNASFSGGFTTAGNLRLDDGKLAGTAASMNGAVVWSGGTLAGQWAVPAGRTLTLQTGAQKIMSGSLSNVGTMAAGDDLYLFGYNTLGNQGTYDLQGDVGIHNAGYSNHFVNQGTLRKSAGTGTSTIGSGTAFDNTGVIDVQIGTIDFAGGDVTFRDGTRFTGAGKAVVSANSAFIGVISSAGRLVLTGGDAHGGDGSPGSLATLDGDAQWTGGTLRGRWTVAAGRTLGIVPGSGKILAGELTNAGTLVATDSLSLFGYNTLTNQGVYELQGDVGIHSAGYSNRFVNQGTLRKTAGTGTSQVTSNTAFANQGIVDVRVGTIEFNGGDASFGDGSWFKGPGQVLVSGSASFSGTLRTQGNLTLSAGSFTGTGATLMGDTRWTGGTLRGNWTIGASHTLSVEAGSSKVIAGAVQNLGTLAVTDHIQLFGYNTLTNAGVIRFEADAGVLNAGYSNTLVNEGLIVKTGGSGVSSLADNALVNRGIIDVRSGTVQLPAGFTNDGTLTGSAAFALSGTLTNAGQVTPGPALATLSIDGHFAQTDVGVLDIQVQTAGLHDLLVISGAVSLNGTVALSCFAACGMAIGEEFVVLDYAGARVGEFSGVRLSGFATGDFQLIYDDLDSRVLMRATETVTAVPEPGTWALMLGGLGLLGLSARGRRC